jgi:hypothetical protein
MDHRAAPAGWDSPADGPSLVRVTIEPGPGGLRRNRRAHVLIAGLGTLPAIAAAAAIAVLPGGSGDSAAPRARTPVVPTQTVPIPRFRVPRTPSVRPTTVLVDGGMRYPDTPLAEGLAADARYPRVTG